LSHHLTDDELVLHFYGEMDRAAERAACTHLDECAECRGQFARLERTLALVGDVAPPPVSPSFEASVWDRLEPALEREPPRRRAFRFPELPFPAAWPRTLAWGAAAAVLLLAAFVAGRGWREPAPVVATPGAAVAAPGPILLADLDGHLERAELALVEFIATDAAQSADQSRAEDLIAANRLYRGTALTTGEPDVVSVLDELERTLIEIATTSAAAGDEEMAAVRERIDSRGLLLKVRVLRQMLEERTSATIQKRDASL
jgi:hypothetical protein